MGLNPLLWQDLYLFIYGCCFSQPLRSFRTQKNLASFVSSLATSCGLPPCIPNGVTASVALGGFLKSTQIYVAPSSSQETFLLVLPHLISRALPAAARAQEKGKPPVFGHDREELIP